MFTISFDPSGNAHSKLEPIRMLSYIAPNIRNV